MGSRHVIAVQHREGEAIGGGGGKKAGAPEGPNRRALIDVTNRGGGVDDVKKPPLHRPITRSFCAQLLAKGQETVTDNNNNNNNNNQKQIAVGNEVEAKGKAVMQKKVTVNPQPQVVIEISPETKEEKSEIRKQTREISSKKKKVHTTTAILTARSKVACGITNKHKSLVEDIDEPDKDNQLAAVEYVEDIYKFYKFTENSSRPHEYMDTQPEINEKMRAILVDWLIDVHNKFELMPETLYLTIHIVDRYLAMKAVSRKHLQLVGMASMLIASKYEEIWAPEVNDFITISDNVYTRENLLAMEKKILGQLEWTLTVPTPYVFLVRYIKAAISDEEMETMTFFMAELGLMHYELIRYCPSMMAASAVYAARCTLNKLPFWDDTLMCHTGFSESQLLDCAKLLVYFHSLAAEGKLQSVRKKYSKPVLGAVALLPPAKNLLA